MDMWTCRRQLLQPKPGKNLGISLAHSDAPLS